MSSCRIAQLKENSILIVTLIICSALSIARFSSSAQSFSKEYIPVKHYAPDSTEMSLLIKHYSDKCNLLKKGQSSGISKQIEKQCKELSGVFTELDTMKRLMYTDTISRYCRNVLDKIIKSNPLLNGGNYILFVQRSVSPNACSMGDGIVLIYLDLLTKIRSEEDLAFIICHELAHDQLEHLTKNIIKQASLSADKKLKRKIRKLGRQVYNQISDLDSLATRLTMDINVFSRRDEIMADSLGLLLYINAGYDPEKAIESVMNLDSLDNEIFLQDENLSQVFSFNGYPFNSIWIYEDTTDLNWAGNLVKEIADTLKTHPDSPLRAQLLSENLKYLTYKASTVTSDISTIRTCSTFEMVEHLAAIKQYDYVLYYCLGLLLDYPDNLYLHCHIVNAFFEISEALRKHRFSEFVNFPQPEAPRTLNKLLRMLNQLTYNEMTTIMTKYYECHIQKFAGTDPFAAYLDILMKSISTDSETIQKLITSYNTNYTNSDFSKKLKYKFNKKP